MRGGDDRHAQFQAQRFEQMDDVFARVPVQIAGRHRGAMLIKRV